MPQENNLLFGPLNFSSSFYFVVFGDFFRNFRKVFCVVNRVQPFFGKNLFKGLEEKGRKHMLQAISRVFKFCVQEGFCSESFFG